MTKPTDYFVRFTPRQRFEHVAVMVTFVALSLTGFPQKWPDHGWSLAIVGLFGGVETMRLVHRACGLLFSVLSVIHLGLGVFELATGRARPTMFATRKDFTDAIQTLRYYLGVAPSPPKFDRYDYKQKFEYWGLVVGSVVMVATGVLLYFPVFFTAVLPGQLIPVAKVAHSNEGLMAFLVIITWHIYNAHFAPGIFPFDTCIFTGKISLERMHHEHPLELARAVGRADGEVATGAPPPPSPPAAPKDD